MNGTWKGADNASEEIRSVHFTGVLLELDVSEFRHTVDCQEHVELALSEAQLADVDMDEADDCVRELAALGRMVAALRQTGDAMTCQTSVPAGSAQIWDAVTQASEHVVKRQESASPELDHHGFLSTCEHGASRSCWAHRRVSGGGPSPPLVHGSAAQAVAPGRGAARIFGRLELGSNSRRCSG